MSKTIGIIGSGAVAKALGSGLLKHGYQITLGTRSPEKLQGWLAEAGPGAHVGSFAEASSFGDIIVLAVKGTGAKEALALAGADNIAGKTLIDTTNPIAAAPPEDGVLKYFTTYDKSLMEELQEAYPNAHFVKAFSSVGSGQMVDPPFDTKPTMFICGNDPSAKAKVNEILELFGWDISDMGRATAARAIEPLAMLWCIPGFLSNEWSHAFKLLK